MQRIVESRDSLHLVERLSGLGLSPEESAVYVHLRRAGATKAGDLAQLLGYARPKAYRLLNGLMHRGFVSATLTRPTEFEAVAPERLFAGLRSALHEREAVLRDAERELAGALAALRGAAAGGRPRVTYKILQGRSETQGVAEAMLREAMGSALLLDAGPSGAAPARVRRFAAERALHGLPLRLLARDPPRVEPSRPGGGNGGGHALPAVRRYEGAHPTRFLVVDTRESLLWIAHDPTGSPEGARESALWSDSPDLAASLAELFQAMWEAAPAGPSRDATEEPVLEPDADSPA